MKGPRSLWQVFKWPVVLGVMTLIGLISALVADGVWDLVSWTMLLIPVALGIGRGWFGRA